MIRVENIEVDRTNVKEVAKTTFRVEKGEILALVGPNDCGAPQLLRAIYDPHYATAGKVNINHFSLQDEPQKAVTQLGYTSATVELPGHLSAFEYLLTLSNQLYVERNKAIKRLTELAEMLLLTPSMYDSISKLSPDQVQLVQLIGAVIHQPSALVLDNPFTYLDYAQTDRVIELIQSLQTDTATVIYLNQPELAEELADSLAVMHKGEIIQHGTLQQLINITKPKEKTLRSVMQQLIDYA